MKIVFYVFALMMLGTGFYYIFEHIKLAESAPQESVIIAYGCFYAIVARIFQAEAHKSDGFKGF